MPVSDPNILVGVGWLIMAGISSYERLPYIFGFDMRLSVALRVRIWSNQMMSINGPNLWPRDFWS